MTEVVYLYNFGCAYVQHEVYMSSSFFTNVARYKKLSGNDLRTILLLSESELRAKDIVQLMQWDKGNVSTILKKLANYGIVQKKKKDAGVYYRINKNWVMPEVAGQYALQFKEN